MKTIKTTSVLAVLAGMCTAVSMQAQPTGLWDFENGNLTATIGSPLDYLDGPGGPTDQATSFNTTTGFGIPNIGGTVAKVMKIGAYGLGSGLALPTPAQPNGGGSSVNNYTLIMDVLFPPESSDKPRAILDTDVGFFNLDSEFFVNADNGIGAKGQSSGALTPNTWHRIAFVVDAEEDPGDFTGTVRLYVDGSEVGSRRLGSLKDGRFSIPANATAALFADDNAETAVGYINSIQLWDVALSKGQLRALNGPAAAGIPAVIPPIPSGIENWIPRGAYVLRNASLGAVIDAGSTTIENSSISIRVNGTAQNNLNITRNGTMITARTPELNLTPGTAYTNIVSYTDSMGGARSFTNVVTAAVFFEDFESITLGPGLEESHALDIGWANTPPTGWMVDNSEMAGFGSPDDDGDGRPDLDGRSEWFGWAFADKEWWVRADDQERSSFLNGTGTVAIADPDEWDDGPHLQGLFNSVMSTPEISLTGLAANTAFVRFASSWRPEGRDDGPPNFPEGNINNQTALITVSYDGGAPVQVMKWDSIEGSPTFHDDAPNEIILVPLNNPAGAQKMVIRFALREGANDWWWAVDNILVNAGASAPTITTHPLSAAVSRGGKVSLTVTAAGTEPFTYQWKRNGEAIPGATSQTLNIDFLNESGSYTVVVTNPGGSAESNPAQIEAFSGPITTDLVTHLKFENDYEDSSSRNNDAAPIGSPQFLQGKLGTAVQIPSGADYVSLGAPADLNFGTSTDFSIAFWAQINGLSSDPSLVGNKNWNGGGNPGYVLFSESDRRMDWNLAGPPGGRKDSSGVSNVFPDNTWRHVVVTFDRDAAAVIYVDGLPVNSTVISGNANNLDTPEGFATNIGQDGTGAYGPSFSDLRVDDFGMWRRALTPQEVMAIYEAGNAGKDLSQAAFSPPSALVTGQWDFNGKNLQATVGEDLQYYGDTIESLTEFVDTTINGQAATVMSFPAADVTQGYIMPHGAAANGGGAFVNEYTLIMDVMFPADSTGRWRGLFQTSTVNGNDGDLFVNPANGIGISGNYSGQILADTWHRIAFVVDLPKSTLSKYIDGVLVGSQSISGIDGRFSVDTTALLFTDEDGETAPGFVNSIQFRQGAMRAEQIAALGGATAAGIPQEGAEDVEITSVAISGNNVVITVAQPGNFQLQRKTSLSQANWENVGAPSSTGTFTVAKDLPAAFFRVEKVQ